MESSLDYTDDHSIGTDPLWQHWTYEVWRNKGVYDSEGSFAAPVPQ